MRKQFGKPGSETALIDYELHQYRLFPYLAYAFSFRNASHFIIDEWSKQKDILSPGKNLKLAELHALITGLKAISTWTLFKGVAECRRACGGLGFSWYSKFSEILAGDDINQTWEGDNNVLLQSTAKYLIE